MKRKEIYLELNSIFDELDMLGVGGEIEGEYDPEVKMLINRLTNGMTRQDIEREVQSVIEHQFSLSNTEHEFIPALTEKICQHPILSAYFNFNTSGDRS